MKRTLSRLILTICALLCPTLAFAQGVRWDGITLSPSGRPVAASVAVCTSPGLTTTAAQVIGNTAILTMSSNPITAGFAANMSIAVSGFTGSDTYFNVGTLQPFVSTVTITAVSATTITYPLTHANASASTNGSVFQMGNVAQACAPLATIFSDAALAVPITQPGLSSSNIGNVGFYVNPGTYGIQFYGTGVTTYLQPLSLNMLFNGAGNIIYVDGSKYATIDAAVAACGSNACTVIIPATGYTGPESVNLVTSNLGYTYYKGLPTVTIIDNRNVTTFGAGRNYSQTYGSYNLGQIDRFGVTQSCASVADSCVGATITNFISGTMPSNVGTQTGLVGIAVTDGPNFNDTSGSAIVGIEGQVALNASGASSTIANSYGMTSSVNILRTTATQSVTNAVSYHSGGGHNISLAGATITNSYGFDGVPETAGTARNYTYHSQGNWLTENGTNFSAVDAGGTPRIIMNFAGSNLTEFRPLLDTQGFEFETQAVGQLFHIDSTKIISRVSHQFVLDVIPSVTAVPSLGNLTFWWKGVSVGANATAATTWSPTTTVNRTLTSPDGNSSTVMPASLVTTAAASDNVTVTGMTASGHCTLSPTNAAGATNIATTFISAKAANQITVSHTASANLNYDILCTPN